MPRLPRDSASPLHDETLGEYVRRVYAFDPDRLTPSERAIAEREIAWTAENKAVAMWLDSWIAVEVKLKHERRRHDDTVIAAGATFLVRARFFDRLLCEGVAGLLLLKPDWLEIVEHVVPITKPVRAQP